MSDHWKPEYLISKLAEKENLLKVGSRGFAIFTRYCKSASLPELDGHAGWTQADLQELWGDSHIHSCRSAYKSRPRHTIRIRMRGSTYELEGLADPTCEYTQESAQKTGRLADLKRSCKNSKALKGYDNSWNFCNKKFKQPLCLFELAAIAIKS